VFTSRLQLPVIRSYSSYNRCDGYLHSRESSVAGRGASDITHCVSPSTSLALLKQLHWLSIECRTCFKLATLTYKTLHTNRPPYSTDLVQYYQPTRCLRSSGSHQLVIPRHNLSLGSRDFSISAPHIWHSTSAKSS